MHEKPPAKCIVGTHVKKRTASPRRNTGECPASRIYHRKPGKGKNIPEQIEDITSFS